jgi:predicted HTH domain antitoxin
MGTITLLHNGNDNAPEYTFDDTRFQDLNTALAAVYYLHKNRRYDLLNEIDPSGILATGECTEIYAALLLLGYQQRRVRPETEARSTEDLDTVMWDYREGNCTLLEAARRAGLPEERFRVEFAGQYGEIPERGFRKTGYAGPKANDEADPRAAFAAYKAGIVGLAAAAKQAGMNRKRFETQLEENGIPKRAHGVTIRSQQGNEVA